MKLLLIHAVLILILACGQSAENSIEGVYTRYSAGEYSKAYDTLIVDAVNKSNNTCLVRRKTGVIRITNGVEQVKQEHSENMLTVYDPATNKLTDPKTGRLFSFGKKELLFGTAAYKKE